MLDERADLTGWWKSLDSWRTTYPLGFEEPHDGSLAPQHVISRIGQIAGPVTSALLLQWPALRAQGLAIALQIGAAGLLASGAWLCWNSRSRPYW